MGAAVVPAVLGGAQLIGGVSQAASQRKQVKAQNEAQKVQLEAQEKQIQAQERATYEQAVLAQMELQQNRVFSEYQTQLGALQRQTAFLQQTSGLAAQGQLENIQAASSRFENEIGRVGAQLQATQGLLGNNTEYMNSAIATAQQQTANETSRYNQLAGADAQRMQGIEGMANAEIGYAQSQGEVASQGRQVFNNLESQEVEAGKAMRSGTRRRAAQEAMFAAAGMGAGGQTNAAVMREDLMNDLINDVEQRAQARGIAAETVESMVRQGRINELSRNLGYEQGAIQNRKGLEQAILANTVADSQNKIAGQQLDYSRQVTNLKNSVTSGELQLAEMSADSNATNIDQQAQANLSAQQLAMQQFNAANAQDEHTDRINQIMSDSGMRIQSGAAASQAAATMESLKAQKQSLVYVPQRAPSLLGAVLSSGLNAYTTYTGATRQQQQNVRAANIEAGKVTQGTSLLGR